MNTPNYLVQSDRGLHGYYDATILRIDLSLNTEKPIAVFELKRGGPKVEYKQVSVESLNQEQNRESA